MCFSARCWQYSSWRRAAPGRRRRDDGRLHVVATVFPAYDFARAAGGELADVELLLPPGTESHSYEPTPADILAVQECDLFLYLGGESDTWVDTILESVEIGGRRPCGWWTVCRCWRRRRWRAWRAMKRATTMTTTTDWGRW